MAGRGAPLVYLVLRTLILLPSELKRLILQAAHLGIFVFADRLVILLITAYVYK